MCSRPIVADVRTASAWAAEGLMTGSVTAQLIWIVWGMCSWGAEVWNRCVWNLLGGHKRGLLAAHLVGCIWPDGAWRVAQCSPVCAGRLSATISILPHAHSCRQSRCQHHHGTRPPHHGNNACSDLEHVVCCAVLSTCACVCSGGGTPHKPDVLGPTGHVIHESTSCANYLMATGVEPHMIYKVCKGGGSW